MSFPAADKCERCGADLAHRRSEKGSVLARVVICIAVCIAAVLGFYVSLILSANPLSIDQKSEVRRSIAILEARGFSSEAFLLKNVTVYRSDDNWLNGMVAKEDAYAATNFPFEIMTLYADFFTYPADEIERAAILLHEAEHLKGKNEHDAYEFVWKNRARLGWTWEKYGDLSVWQNIRKQTRDNVPELFNCPDKPFGDCTE